MVSVSSLFPDYDSEPDRWRSHSPRWLLGGDVHAPVVARIVESRLDPVLDVGGGTGALGGELPDGWPIIVVDNSVRQIDEAAGPKVLGHALHLPIGTSSVGAVAALWMLYHLDYPHQAIAEAWRVLRSGGLFFASTAARNSDPELTDGYPPTTFDAEDAERIVRQVFDEVEVERWDAPLTMLPDRVAVLAFCRSHHLPSSAAERVEPPVTLTKRGCLVCARR
jgi:SAM-dependent methyltransferase